MRREGSNRPGRRIAAAGGVLQTADGGTAGIFMQRFDVIVLGAGIVGVSAAWHLLRRGKTVALVDRRAPGEETSHGNAGVVERDGFLPMGFPQRFADLLRYGLNRQPEMSYHAAFLPTVAPFLF